MNRWEPCCGAGDGEEVRFLRVAIDVCVDWYKYVRKLEKFGIKSFTNCSNRTVVFPKLASGDATYAQFLIIK